jgi:hypothetical protein
MLSNPAPICYYKNMKKLTVREKKLVAGKVAGKTNAKAYLDAGYKANSRAVADSNAYKVLKKEKIKDAIDTALEHHGATPEFAVGVLKNVADQDKEIGAKRLAAKDILELHGWQRGERPNVTLDIKNATFFAQTRQQD